MEMAQTSARCLGTRFSTPYTLESEFRILAGLIRITMQPTNCHSTRHPMIFDASRCWHFLSSRSAVLFCSIAIATGCASAPSPRLKFEPLSFADTIGLHGCRISVPLTPSKVIEDSKRGGNPNPETGDEWSKIADTLQDGDQLRLINCDGVQGIGDTVYYALIRNHAVLLKFHPMILD